MPMTAATHGSGLGCEIAIKDLPVELRLMRKGELYCLGITEEADAFNLARAVLDTASYQSRAVLVSTVDLSNLLANSAPDKGPAEIRFYRLTGGLASALPVMARDLDRLLRPRERTVILVVPADCFDSCADDYQRLLAGWHRWLSANQCSLLLLVHGAGAVKLTSAMLAFSDILSGLAAMVPDGAERLYRVLHWRNALAVTGRAEFTLVGAGTGYQVRQRLTEPTAAGSDADTFYIERSVLEGASVFMAKDWHVFDHAKDVFNHAMLANAATVVFALNSIDDITEQARRLHALRQQRGPSLKLVLREMQRSLRYPDEQLLLACGVNLVVPAEISLPRLFSLLESIQGQTYRQELVSDLERYIERSRSPSLQGIVDAECFSTYVNRMLEHLKDAACDGILVALTPVPGLAAVHSLGQLNMRRMGDVACELDGVVYLFLYGCRPALADIALTNVFHLSYREMFSEHMVYASISDIQSQLTRMRRTLFDGVSKPPSVSASDALSARGVRAAQDMRNENFPLMQRAHLIQPTLGMFDARGSNT